MFLLVAGYLHYFLSDTDDSVIAVPLSLFRGFNNNCHLVLDGQFNGADIPSELTTACQCVLAATIFDGISAYLSSTK